MISADVDGCEVLLSFCFDEEAVVVVEETGLCPCDELSDASPFFFLFLAILQQEQTVAKFRSLIAWV
jgi:hypothetical protein